MDAICKEVVWKNIGLRSEICCIPRGKKAFGNLNLVNFVVKMIPGENIALTFH